MELGCEDLSNLEVNALNQYLGHSGGKTWRMNHRREEGKCEGLKTNAAIHVRADGGLTIIYFNFAKNSN